MNLTEAHIRKIVREVLSEALILEISAEEKGKVMAKSNERVPFSVDLMKQAIEQGREVGINYRSSNDKYEMPVTKSRIIHPVAMGTDSKGNLVIRGLHITGQSEKAARETGVRSAEVEAERDGMNAWRLFKTSNLRSMWFTDRFFSDNIKGFNPNDKAMVTKIAVYNPGVAKKHQDQLVAQSQQQPSAVEKPAVKPVVEPTIQKTIQPQGAIQTKAPADKDIEQMGYSNNPAQPNKNIRKFFK
ncbi:MAG: hypothetical protein AABY15_04140 [Nanoarchaeota archaeon]